MNYPKTEEFKNEITQEITQYFDNFNIALYCALEETSLKAIIKQSKANYVELESKHFDIPTNALNLSYLMAGTVLLEAMDNNADFLLVNNQEELSLFDANQKDIEKAMGREINLPVVTKSEFILLLEGEKDKNTIGLNLHKVKVPFLD